MLPSHFSLSGQNGLYATPAAFVTMEIMGMSMPYLFLRNLAPIAESAGGHAFMKKKNSACLAMNSTKNNLVSTPVRQLSAEPREVKKFVNISAKIEVSPETTHSELMELVNKIDFSRLLGILTVTPRFKTIVDGVRDAEGRQVADVVISLGSR